MTDNEIIKALEDLFKLMLHDGDLQRTSIISKALDLIKRQKVEIERLNIELQAMRNAANSYKKNYETAKSEAIKEFAERLKHFIIPQKADGYTREIVLKRDIDNLVKEMTEVEINQRKEDEGK